MTPAFDEFMTTDVLVIGAGLAGVRAALAAREQGAQVVMALKGQIGVSGNSAGATGGFAVAMGNDDPPAAFGADIQRGGFCINDERLVELVSAGSYDALCDLVAMGFDFPVGAGRDKAMPAPGHAFPRSVRYAPGGMWHFMRQMGERIVGAGVHLLENHQAAALVGRDGVTGGALLWDCEKGRPVLVAAGAVVLATGGCGRIYPITTNKRDVTGDGYALALQAGCSLRDMEFIQFTPTSFAAPKALRGMTMGGALLSQKGVRLLNADGHRFMADYDPVNMEKAVRSVLSRAIFKEVSAGRGSPGGGVYLDLTSLSADTIERLKPGLLRLAREHGVDPVRDLMETGISAHHCLGGVAVDAGLSATPGLFVAGETLGGTHGANRLSSNSLTEANVTGRLCGLNAAAYALERSLKPTAVDDLVVERRSLPSVNDVSLPDLASRIQMVMGAHAVVSRTEEGLSQASRDLADMRDAFDSMTSCRREDVSAWLDIRAMLTVANAIVTAARMRRESRGAHFREDYPGTDDMNWLGNIYIRLGPDGLVTKFNSLSRAA